MNQATVLGGLGLALSLAFALVHLLWGLPRLSARWAWA